MSTQLFKTGLFSLLLACSAGMAQDETTGIGNALLASSPSDGSIHKIDSYTIENKLAGKKIKVQESFWRTFMHGVPDASATPIPWQALAPDLKFTDAKITTPFKTSDLPAIKLGAKETLRLPVPVLDSASLYKYRGAYLRFFIWIKGTDTGRETDLWNGAPAVRLDVFDIDGSLAGSASSLFKTRGTFDWFCYYIDIQIPTNLSSLQSAAKTETDDETAFLPQILGLSLDSPSTTGSENGLYITLSNPASGTALFSTLSYQRIRPDDSILSHASKERHVDPRTGSLAPNPDCDELPLHFFFGLSKEHSWDFLHGTRTLPDLTRKAELQKYLAAYANDWFHAVHAIPYLACACNKGKLLKKSEGFEDGWEDTLLAALVKLQDPATGLWTVNGTPNLFASQLIASNSFHPASPLRKGQASAETPWLSIKNQKLAKPDEIIRSLVSQQRKNGKTPCGWNAFAFYPENLEVPEQKALCDLAATASAATLLAQAAPLASADSQAMAQEAIRAAWEYFFSTMVLKSGLWKANSLDALPSRPACLFSFLEATQLLEMRQGKNLAPITVTSKIDERGNLSVKWNAFQPYLSLRVYVAPSSVKPEDLKVSHLFAILQAPNASIQECDPLVAAMRLASSAKKTWGMTPALEGAAFTASQLAACKAKVIQAKDTLKVRIPAAGPDQTIHIAAVTGYGELSPWVTLPETIAGTNPDANEEPAAEE